MLETTVLLRSILIHAEEVEDIDDVRGTLRAMCTKDDLDAVEVELQRRRNKKAGMLKDKPQADTGE